MDALQAPLALLLLERCDLVSICADKLQLQALRRVHSLQVQVGGPRKTSSLRRDSLWGKCKKRVTVTPVVRPRSPGSWCTSFISGPGDRQRTC